MIGLISALGFVTLAALPTAVSALPNGQAANILMAVAPTIAALLAYLQSRRTKTAIQEVHLSLNSRLTELLAEARAGAHAAGKVEGIAEQKARQSAHDVAKAEGVSAQQAVEKP